MSKVEYYIPVKLIDLFYCGVMALATQIYKDNYGRL